MNSLEYINFKMSAIHSLIDVLAVRSYDYQLFINGLITVAAIAMIFLLWNLSKSLKSLQESSYKKEEKGEVWINQNLYSFNAEQLKTLIKKINEADKNEQQVETKNQ